MNITKQRLARIIAEEVSRHDRLVKERRIKNLIKETVIQESAMKELHTTVGDSILFVLSDNPGIDGMGLVGLVQADLDGDEDFIMARGPMGSIDQDEIFTVLDDLQDDGQVIMDVENDGWYDAHTPEAQAMMDAQVQGHAQR